MKTVTTKQYPYAVTQDGDYSVFLFRSRAAAERERDSGIQEGFEPRVTDSWRTAGNPALNHSIFIKGKEIPVTLDDGRKRVRQLRAEEAALPVTWTPSTMGAKGGSATSEAKARAARRNGRKGGRRKKS